MELSNMSYSSEGNVQRYLDKDGERIVNSFKKGANFVISIGCQENEFNVSEPGSEPHHAKNSPTGMKSFQKYCEQISLGNIIGTFAFQILYMPINADQ